MNVKEILFSLPEKVKPEVLEGRNSLFHFDIAGAGQFTVKIEDGKLEVTEGFEGEPTCKVSASTETLAKLRSGELSPTKAIMFGKLKVSNPMEIWEYAKIFGLM